MLGILRACWSGCGRRPELRAGLSCRIKSIHSCACGLCARASIAFGRIPCERLFSSSCGECRFREARSLSSRLVIAMKRVRCAGVPQPHLRCNARMFAMRIGRGGNVTPFPCSVTTPAVIRDR